MKQVRSPAGMQALAREMRRGSRRIGFVPTMGALHEGHLSLLDRARPLCDVLVVSIFVNPLQFGAGEDLDRYPRDIEGDASRCASRGADMIFCPQPVDMYPPDQSAFVVEEVLSTGLCGASRPGHFRGVATVVAKLFNIVLPDVAVFGQKDAQQVAVIKRMVRDLDMPVRIEVAPIVREADGLAMSSRNTYLTGDQRRQAGCLSRALQAAHDAFSQGERRATVLRAMMRAVVDACPRATIDYIALVHADTLAPVQAAGDTTLAALAVTIGETRLIDNTVLGDPPPLGRKG